VLAESAMMIPETRARLEAALSDLQGFVVGSINAIGHVRARASSRYHELNLSTRILTNAHYSADSAAGRERPGRHGQRRAVGGQVCDHGRPGHLQLMIAGSVYSQREAVDYGNSCCCKAGVRALIVEGIGNAGCFGWWFTLCVKASSV
jgi:hypothetical protein